MDGESEQAEASCCGVNLAVAGLGVGLGVLVFSRAFRGVDLEGCRRFPWPFQSWAYQRLPGLKPVCFQGRYPLA